VGGRDGCRDDVSLTDVSPKIKVSDVSFLGQYDASPVRCVPGRFVNSKLVQPPTSSLGLGLTETIRPWDASRDGMFETFHSGTYEVTLHRAMAATVMHGVTAFATIKDT